MIDPLSALRATLAGRGLPGWLVGGAVRDRLLGRAALDVDVVVAAGAVAAARAVAAASGGAFVPLSPERGIARVVWPGRDGAADAVLDVTECVGGGLERDLAARDFTVNALAVPLDEVPDATSGLRREAVIDVAGGLADLDAGRVRMVAAAAFDADPLRLLRGPRLAAELGFALDDATSAAIAARAASLRRPAGERVRDELARLLAVDDAADWVRRLDALGLLAVVLPEVTACRDVGGAPHDVLAHALAVLDGACRLTRRLAGDDRVSVAAAADAVIDGRRAGLADHAAQRIGGRRWAVWWRLAALLHDIGKPATARWDAGAARWRYLGHEAVGAEQVAGVAHRLRLGAEEAERITAVVRHHLRPLALADDPPPSRRAVYRYFRATGPAGVDVALHALVDRAAKPEPGHADLAAVAGTVEVLLAAWYDAPEVAVAPPPLLDGRDVMARFGVAPGPRLGALLAGLREAQAAGEVGTIDEAYAWIAHAVGSG